MQPWEVLTAPLVEWRLPKDQNESLPFQHVKTGVTDVCGGCARGFSFWEGNLQGNPVYMAFDWVELRPGVPILTDPNAVISNLCLVDVQHERESKLKEVVHLSLMVYKLQWQQEASEAVCEHGRDAKLRAIQELPRSNKASLVQGEGLMEMKQAA
jgi:hypothetical protein